MPPSQPIPTAASTLLEVRNLSVELTDDAGPRQGAIRALDSVGFSMAKGERVGVLGESGSGKTTLGKAILGLLPRSRWLDGSIRWRGQALQELPEEGLAKLRGAEIAMIFQEPDQALNPLRKVGLQIVDVLRAHRPSSRREGRAKVISLLAELGLDDAEELFSAYPHQLSGGQRQRVAIAQALICEPALIIADEPAAALDEVNQRRVSTLLAELRRRQRTAWLYISHDPTALASLADRLLVLYAGRLIEEGTTSEVLVAPRHPYTRALLQCQPPPPGQPGERRRLPVIPGEAPVPRGTATCCRFAPRCPVKLSRCEMEVPSVREGPSRHKVWCFNDVR